VSVPSRERVKSRSHSIITAVICSRNVSWPLRTVIPRSTCAKVRAVSNNFGTLEPHSTTSRPCSSIRCAMSLASCLERPVVSIVSCMTSSKLCLSSFQRMTQ
jgi:hypothetical protein